MGIIFDAEINLYEEIVRRYLEDVILDMEVEALRVV